MSLTDAPRIIASRTSSSFWGSTAPISEPTSRPVSSPLPSPFPGSWSMTVSPLPAPLPAPFPLLEVGKMALTSSMVVCGMSTIWGGGGPLPSRPPAEEPPPGGDQLDLSGRLTVKPNLAGRGRPAVESVVGREGIPNPSTAKGGSRGALHGNDAEQPVLPSLCDELLDHGSDLGCVHQRVVLVHNNENDLLVM